MLTQLWCGPNTEKWELEMNKLLIGAAVLAASMAISAAPALARCKALMPVGRNGDMNIRSGPSLDDNVQDNVAAGQGILTYCGDWQLDANGNRDDYNRPFKWLHVTYTINNRDGETTGWVASAVVAGWW